VRGLGKAVLPGRSSAGWVGGGAAPDFDFGLIRHSIPLITATIDFRIIDETDNYIVVDKPAFLLTHPTKPDHRTTLWKELRELLAFEIANGGQVSIVNRLDRETSGVVLVAKTSAAARRFGLLMQDRHLNKEYLAIVWGWPDWETKILDAPMDRQGKHQPSAIWLKQTIHPKGAKAFTEFRVEQRFAKNILQPSPAASQPPGRDCDRAEHREDGGEGRRRSKFSLIRAIPKTGRTHQIRVHLASLGYPIVGDKIYGPNEKLYLEFIETGWTPKLEGELLLPRHALHSARLAIETEREWTAELPADLAQFIGA
jgi:23S rRNA pseudouridine1911/1915/1917 synthase